MLLSPLLSYNSGALKFKGWGLLHDQGLYCALSLPTEPHFEAFEMPVLGCGVVLSQVDHSVPSLVDNGLADHL